MKISPKRRAKALWRGASSAWSPVRLRSGQAEEDDAMLVQRVADLGHRAVVEILARVDGAGEQAYLESGYAACIAVAPCSGLRSERKSPLSLFPSSRLSVPAPPRLDEPSLAPRHLKARWVGSIP